MGHQTAGLNEWEEVGGGRQPMVQRELRDGPALSYVYPRGIHPIASAFCSPPAWFASRSPGPATGSRPASAQAGLRPRSRRRARRAPSWRQLAGQYGDLCAVWCEGLEQLEALRIKRAEIRCDRRDVRPGCTGLIADAGSWTTATMGMVSVAFFASIAPSLYATMTSGHSYSLRQEKRQLFEVPFR